MDVFEALYTTRAMRRVSEDPIPDDVLKQMIDASIRAPSGSNRQGWKFIVVTDPDIKNQLGDLYREAWDFYIKEFYGGTSDLGASNVLDDEKAEQVIRITKSATLDHKSVGPSNDNCLFVSAAPINSASSGVRSSGSIPIALNNF